MQYLKSEVRDGVHFLHADKHQSSYKLALLLLMEVTGHVQRTQNSNLVIFFQLLKENVSQLLLYFTVMQKIQIFYRGKTVFVVSCFPEIQKLLTG